jgi:hypothetical protein
MEEQHKSTATKKRKVYYARMDEGRKRVIGIIAGILVANHMDVANDLFGGPQGSPRTDKMIAAAVQWAERIMRKVDNVFSLMRHCALELRSDDW